VTRTLVVTAAAILIVLVLGWAFQRRMIYFPFGGAPALPPGLTDVEEATLRTADGVSLGAWFIRAAAPVRAAVIVFNGNAGNRSFRLPFARALARMGADVLLFDYRGFGGNAGSPSRAGLIEDARAARAWLAARAGVDAARVVYFGESLGAAVAAELAAETPPALLILRSPFASLAAIGRHHYPLLPVGWLLRDRFDVIGAVARVHVPTLVIAGAGDRIVPVEQSRQVFRAAARPHELVIVPGADHNDEALFTGEILLAAIDRLLGAARTP
jgi:fermentation-respiration switch protein FrsA (DUF1100 family)